MKKNITRYAIILLIIGMVLAIDLTFKHFFCFEQSKDIIPNLINFQTNHGNDGVAFGMFAGKKWPIIVMTIVLIAVFVAFEIWKRPKSKTFVLGFSFIVGGAIGNLVDRLKFGYVRDFINFTFWPSFPTFNMADTFLCIGVGLVCVYLLFFSHKEEQK